MNSNYKKWFAGIIAAAIIIRIILLFFAPISMFADGVIRYLPYAEKVLHFDFSFNDVPLLVIIEAIWMLLFKGNALFFVWKITSFIFFLGTIFLIPSLIKRLSLDKIESIIFIALMSFSAWSLLLSVTVLQDMMVTFFALALFLNIENYFEKPSKKTICLLILLSFLIILAKLTGIIILAGFSLYVLFKKDEETSRKIKSLFYLSIGALVTVPWFIKNYALTGKIYLANFTPPAISLHSMGQYADYLIKTFHYFWEIPLPAKVNFSGLLSSLYNLYYFGALTITALLSLLILISLILYSKKYKNYLLIIVPIFLFSFYWAFLIFWGPHDVGRYTFPLWLFLFLPVIKLISNFKGKIRGLFYLLIALFCLVSIISAFGITLHMYGIDSQILEINNALTLQNSTGTFITNDQFTASALSFYLKNRVQFNLETNEIDKSVNCTGELIFFSKNYKVFKENSEYRICRV